MCKKRALVEILGWQSSMRFPLLSSWSVYPEDGGSKSLQSVHNTPSSYTATHFRFRGSIYRAAHTHLPVVVTRRVWGRRTITRHPPVLLSGNAGVRRALHKARGPWPWPRWRACGPRRDSTAGLWGEVQVRLWRRSVGKARGHGEEEVVRQSFIRLQNTTARG